MKVKYPTKGSRRALRRMPARRKQVLGLVLAVVLLAALAGTALAGTGGLNGVADVRALDAQAAAPNAPQVLPSIGDYVWYDLNADGLHNTANEQEFTNGIGPMVPPVPPVEVRLYEDANGNCQLDPAEKLSYRSTTTGDNPNTTSVAETGWYSFGNIPLDNLCRFVEVAGGVPANYILTSQNTYGGGNTYVTVPPLTGDFFNADFGFATAILTLTKVGSLNMAVVSPTTRADVGDKINYTLTATNQGQATLTHVTVVDTKAAPLTCTPAQPATLTPGQSITCTGSYTLTQADINAGKVDNIATADSDQTPPVDKPNTVTVPQAPALTLTKNGVLDMTVVAPTDRADVGDKINYTLTATNTGNQTLTGVTVTDPKLGTLSCAPTQPGTLAPGASMVCTGSYTLTQADINAGKVDNTATADSNETPPTNTPNTVPVPQTPSLTLTKAGTLDMTVVAPTNVANVGDKINYTLTATNTGNQTLTGVTVTDPKLGTLSCAPTQPGTLAPGASMICTGSYTLTQADINAGKVDNTATADSDQTPPTDRPNTVPVPQVPALNLTKVGTLDMTVVAPANVANVGDKINYTLTATNAGNMTLTGVTVVDAKLGTLTCSPTQPGTLAPGASMVCTGSYTLTQADIDAGKVDNVATADSNETPAVQAPHTEPVPQAPALTLTKVGTLDMTVVQPADQANVGDKISYTLTATNTGNQTLTGVTIVDAKLGTLTCNPTQPGTLAPGASMACTGSYTLTQADLNTGKVDNTATADSDQTPPVDKPNTVPLPQGPRLSLTKTGVLDMTVVAPADRADSGDKINYTLTATNSGNVTLTGVTIADPLLGALICTPNQPGTLTPGQSMICTGSYTLKQSDLNTGKVDNTATADSDQTPPVTAPHTEPLTQAPGLTLAKVGVLDMTVVSPATRADVGDKINYTLTATNVGNVTLTGVTVVDAKLGTLACNPTQPGTLAPGTSMVCTGAYTLTQADINAGDVLNTATADSDQTPRTDTPNRVPVPPAPALTLTKAGVLDMTVVAPNDVANVGDKINYTLTAKNTGNVPLTGVTIVDAKVGTLTCTPTQPGTLAPGASMVCTGSYTLTQADIAAGKVDNVATGDSDQTPPTDTPNTVPVPQQSIIGDYVWWDEIFNGLQDPAEKGIPNVPVELRDANNVVIATTTTDSTGHFQFRVPPGTYTLKIADSAFQLGGALFNWEATTQFAGSNPAIDSNGDPVTHAAPPVTVTAGVDNTTVDFGFKQRPTGIGLAGYSVTAVDGGVLIEWLTNSETDIAGFAVVRGDAPVGGAPEGVFIAAQHAGAGEGASYSITDTAPGAGGYALLIYKADGSQERVELNP